MQILMSKLHENAKEFGLEINFSKTKLMYVGKNRNYPRQHITLAGQDVEVVKQFDYLGRILSCDGDDTYAVESRISKGWQAFQKNKDFITK